jgi:fibronectin-binding autotransporter adhesin
MKRIVIATAAVALVIAGASVARAQATWSGGSTATWNNTSFWSTGAVPTAATAVVLAPSAGATMNVINGVIATATSIDFANIAGRTTTISIADGGRLNVGGAITDTGAGNAVISVNNTSSANAASILTATSIALHEFNFNGGGTQFLTMNADLSTAVQVNIGNTSGTATYRQTGGTLTTSNGGFGLTLIEASSANPTGTATFILDGGRVMSDRIGVGNGNGNNGAAPRYAANGSFVFNSGTVQPRSGQNTFFQNGNARTSGTTTDTQYDTSKPITIALAGTGTHEFNAPGGTNGNIFVTPSAQIRDQAGQAGTLVKTGVGSLILTGNGPVAVNDWTGASTVSAGTLLVDYSQIAGTATSGSTTALANAYSAASQLILNGGNFTLTGRPNGSASSQTNLAINAGTYNLTVTSTAGLTVGQAVTNANLPAGTYIRRITNATTVELNAYITGTTNLTGQTFDFAAANFTNSQTINSVALQQTGTVTVNPAGNATLLTFGTVSGAAGFVKAGTGTLRLAGPVSYTGTTNVSAGAIEVAAASGTSTLVGSLVGSGTVLKTGNSAMIVSGTGNTFTGPLSITGGMFQIGTATTSNASSQRLGVTSAVTVGPGANLVFKNSNALENASSLLVSGTISTDVAGVAGGGFVNKLGNGPITMSGGAIVANLGANGSSFQSYALGGDVTVTGSSASVISVAPGAGFDGVHLAWTTAAGTTRTFTVADVTGDSAADLAVSARLINTANTLAATNLTKAGAGTMLLSGSNGYTGSTTVNAGVLDFSTVTALQNTSGVSVASGALVAYSGTTSGTLAVGIGGAGGFSQSGVGTLALSGSNGFTGATSLNAGTLALASAGALSATGTLSFGGGTLQYGPANQTDFSAIIRGSTQAVAIDTNGQSVVFASPLDGSNAGGFRKLGAGTLQLTNAAPGLTGTTTINAGTLELAASSGTVTLAASLVGTGGTLARTGGGTTLIGGTGNTFAGALSVAAGLVQIGTATTSNVGTQALGSVSNITVGSGAALVLKNSTAINSAAPIALSGTLSTDVAGVAGGGFTNYLGPLTMSGGSLIANSGANTSTFQSYAFAAGVTVTGSAASAISTAPGAVGGGVHLTHVVGGLRAFDVADVTGSAAADLLVSAALINATSSGSASGLRKTGVGTMLLSSTSTYSGATQVAAGTLLVNGQLANTSGVTVDAGATLGGAGVIAALATVNGTLSPGNSPGELTLASLALGSTATTLIEVTGTTRGSQYDGITLTQAGGLTYGGTLSFDFASLLGDNTTLDIFSFTGSPSGAFSSVASTGSYAGTWTNNNDGTHSLQQGSQTLTFSQLSGDVIIVPEPGVLALAGAGLATGVIRVWSRRRSRR